MLACIYWIPPRYLCPLYLRQLAQEKNLYLFFFYPYVWIRLKICVLTSFGPKDNDLVFTRNSKHYYFLSGHTYSKWDRIFRISCFSILYCFLSPIRPIKKDKLLSKLVLVYDIFTFSNLDEYLYNGSFPGVLEISNFQ